MRSQFSDNLLFFSPAFIAHKEYWISKLSYHHESELISTGPGCNTSGKLESMTFNIDPEVGEHIQKIGKHADLPVFLILLSAVKVLIRKYQGNSYVTVLSPLNIHEPVSDLSDYTIIQSSINENMSFKDYLLSVSRTVIDAGKHQEYPAARILEDLELDGDGRLSRIICAMEGVHRDDLQQLPEDLCFRFIRQENNLSCVVRFHPGCIDSVYVQQAILHLHVILKAVTADIQAALSTIAIIRDEEEGVNGKMFPEDVPAPVYTTLFEKQVTAFPQRTAIEYRDEKITYTALNEHANRLAAALNEKFGLQPDDLVAIMMDRSPLMVASILAVWKCGAAYLPLDPASPAARIEEIMHMASPRALLCGADYRDNWAQQYAAQIFAAEDASGNIDRKIKPAASSSLAYVIYTSGSTGMPKGVMIEQGGMMNHLLSKKEELQINADSIIIQNASQCFDISIWQFFAALICGGKTVIIDEATVADIPLFCAEVQHVKATLLELVPSYLDVMMEYLEQKRMPLSLEYLLSTGEELKPAQTEKWFATYPDIRIVNAYGPTEASDDVTHYIIEKPVKSVVVPVGLPVRNTRIYIINENFEPCPRGVKGEIIVAGAGIGRGYLSDEAKTREVFLNNPFFESGNERMYRTGDYGRFNKDGLLEFLGRKDEQVKIKGFRIELHEIEIALENIAGVSRAIVRKMTGNDGEDYLCAYYIAEDAKEMPNTVVKMALAEKLPAYMVPLFLVRMLRFPLKRNGKIDRSALPVPKFADKSIDEESYKTVETTLTQLWKRILGVREVTLHDNFFTLGGHSLSASRLIVHLHKEFDIKLDLQTVFKYPTIAELIPVIAAAEIDKYRTIAPVRPASAYGLSQAQKRIWIISQIEEEKYIFNIPQSYILEGELNEDAFIQALSYLVERHEILRTTFTGVDGEPWQEVHPLEESGFSVTFIDLRHEADQEGSIRKMVQDEEKFPFDLENGPLIRASLLKLADDRYIFLLTLHHIIADGWSLEVIRNDVFKKYNSILHGENNTFTSLSIQYKDYAAWQAEILHSTQFQAHKVYWLDKFSGEVPVLDIPADYSRPVEKTYRGRSIETALGTSLSNDIITFAQEHNVSLFMFLLATVKLLLYRYSSQTDLVVGTPVAARGHNNLEDQVGFYVNLLPLRSTFSQENTFSELLEIVKENCLDAFKHELYPFDHLVNELSLSRDLSRSPLFDVLVVLQNVDMDEEGAQFMEGIRMETYPLERSVVKYDLSFNFSVTEGIIGLSFEYNTDLYADSRMKQLILHYKNIVECILAGVNEKIGRFDYLCVEEREQLLSGFNPPYLPYPRHFSVLDFFTEKAREIPGATALVCRNRKYTYNELNTLTGRLANFLIQEHRISPGDNVAVCLERNEYSVLMMLAVLKTGACYVPVESRLPAGRKEYILKDLQPALVVINKGAPVDFIPANIPVTSCEDADTGLFPEKIPDVRISGEMLSYVIYTSGSTGYPKGVMQTHKTLYNLIRWQKKAWNIPVGLRFLQYASFGFDASLHDILFALATGGEIYLLDDIARESYREISKVLVEEQIDVIWFTFSALQALFNELEEEVLDAMVLKHIVTTGEAASLNNRLGGFLKNHPEVVLHNFYGPSETHVITSYDILEGNTPFAISLPIGAPVDNTAVYILNEALVLQPVGIPGEIYVDTDNMFTGYLRLEEQTSKAFVPHPFNSGKVLYRTGDFGSWMNDGNIRFLGRKDKQVKIRGFRIELKEIEYVISQFEGIHEALVTCREDKMLITYYTVTGEVDVTMLEIYLRQRLPDYMVPAHFIKMEAMPLNSNGKVDTGRLPQPQHFSDEDARLLPLSITETRLREVWQDILQQENIGINDNFFRIGGHSLAATRLASRILKEFNTDINLRKIYRYSTIRELAVEIESQQWVNKSQSNNEYEAIMI